MRTRRSNQAKRYRPSDFDSAFASDDEELARAAPAEGEESEEGYRDDDGAVESESDAKDAELDALESSESELEPKERPLVSRTPKPVAVRPKKRDVPAQAATARPLERVADYPLDPSAKWTRAYTGPLKRWTRFNDMVMLLYSDREHFRKVVSRIARVWWNFQVLPPRPVSEKHLRLSACPWVASNFAEDQQRRLRDRLSAYAEIQSYRQISHPIELGEGLETFVPKANCRLTVLLGEYGDQQAHPMLQGESIPISEHGLPMRGPEEDSDACGGWLLDVGGIVVAMNWAPLLITGYQLLAMSVIPKSDQDFQKDLLKAPKPSEQKEGNIQIWRFEAEKDDQGILRPSRKPPTLANILCAQWGRIARSQWCPIAVESKDTAALLGVLCADGKLRVVGTKHFSEALEGSYEQISEPMATVEFPNEHNMAITCFAWVNTNRIAVGCSDGSIALWSIFPCQLLQRHPIHSSSVIDIASGYPSQPSYVASLPMGGVLTLTNLDRPTAEMTYNANLSVSLQPNLLAWSEVLRGYLSMWPTNFTANSTVSFSGLTTFPQPRHIMTVEGQVTCLGMSPCHPFVLVGTSDGSLWSTNVLRKIMGYREKVNKIRIFKHEYRPPAPPAPNQDPSRGVVRVLHGYLPEVNDHPRANFTGKQASDAKKAKNKKAPKAAGRKSQASADDDGFDAMDESGAMTFATGPLIIEDPLTRITSISWNPNAEFSCWAAVAMASGLVRIIDLGLDNGANNGSADSESSDGSGDAEMPDLNDEDD